jgi:hypothetical protein
MRLGGWVPISKSFLKYLPKDRAYTELEAAFSLQNDYDNSNKATVLGYANLWQWSRSRVKNFLNKMGVEIIYPDDTYKNKTKKDR